MTTINSRASWGARHDDGDKDLYGLAEEVAIHHTVTHAGGTSPKDEREHMRELEDIGQSRFGHGISYNVLVFPSGRPYQGVSFSRRGTHTGDHNSTVRSVCFVGNFEHDTPTPAALATAAAIIAEGRGELWERDAPVKGHRDYKDTACPGDHLYAHLDDLAAGKASPATPTPTAPAQEDYDMRTLDLTKAATKPVKGEDVAKLQGLLLAHGYGPRGLVGTSGRPDGIAGKVTRQLLGKFQAKTGTGTKAGPDYIAGPRTWLALIEN
ncbi:peptidoglycan-binding domain-containing protein [Promicromonospora sp. MEB111]|uniref:peptidoglycan recognition protein family protein n=1 Tax=Promicromonospora sp. MEB111 TaxID=3040301 RepID=UPI002550E3AB|nr:peptidoglycan-binding domain-containing protein [Promicromonospora sp. MEB111]